MMPTDELGKRQDKECSKTLSPVLGHIRSKARLKEEMRLLGPDFAVISSSHLRESLGSQWIGSKS